MNWPEAMVMIMPLLVLAFMVWCDLKRDKD
jgi:hypothetical protein